MVRFRELGDMLFEDEFGELGFDEVCTRSSPL